MIALFFNLYKHGPVDVVSWSTEIFLECSIVKSTVMVGLPFVPVKYKLHLVDWSEWKKKFCSIIFLKIDIYLNLN
jgi:hypothetical protein